MMIEIVNFDGRSFRVSWVPGHYPPNDFQVVQASAVCFANRGAVVLVSAGDGAWGLPGGHIEPGESAAAAMRREVFEEATATVVAAKYIGSTRVQPTAGGQPFYQSRFWAHVKLNPFHPTPEAQLRRVFPVSEVADRLSWSSRAIAEATICAALDVDRSYPYCEIGEDDAQAAAQIQKTDDPI